eukprot:7931603-Lingulodinium_polyedra.AAC.1
MGLAPSAGWAQAVTDLAASKAHVPEAARVRFDAPAPPDPPIWGSIIDDLWAIEQREGHQPGPQVRRWMRGVDREWPRLGVPLNHAKCTDGEVTGEFQGTVIHGTQQWLGTSRARRLEVLAVALYVLGSGVVYPRAFERFVGKLGYAQSFRSCQRSTLQATY